MEVFFIYAYFFTEALRVLAAWSVILWELRNCLQPRHKSYGGSARICSSTMNFMKGYVRRYLSMVNIMAKFFVKIIWREIFFMIDLRLHYIYCIKNLLFTLYPQLLCGVI
jgi:hypothetical protein